MVCMYKFIRKSIFVLVNALPHRLLKEAWSQFSLEAGDIMLCEARLTDVAESGTGSSPKIRFPNPALQSFCSSVFGTHFILSSLTPTSEEIFPDNQNQTF